VGGGGDGLALREILKWSAVEHVDLVDLDPQVTRLALEHPALRSLNEASLSDERVSVHNADAFQWVEQGARTYDAIILDFPDPTSLGVGKLFTTTFFARVSKILSTDGTLVVQATSPFLSPNSFWTIERTIGAVGLRTQPIRVFVPSFGDWGFVLARHAGLPVPPVIPSEISLRCLDNEGLVRLSELPSDTRPSTVAVNRLDNQILVQIYLNESQRLD
jgi:spermidine synthase